MDESLRLLVFDRAGQRCEYCRMPMAYDVLPFQVDHIRPQKHRGQTTADNLALTCYNCNAHKGPNLAGIDSETDAMTPLFDPRQHHWAEHFAWDDAQLRGLTPIGRVTVEVLNVNDADRVEIRRELITAGLFPPVTDD